MGPLAAVALLLVAAVAVVEAIRLVRNARRATRINRAVHELRRPLQSMALALGGERCDLRGAEACLEQARCALADLDAAINGGAPGSVRVRVALGEIAAALEERWRSAGVRVEAPMDAEAVEADPHRLGAALDNLVANSLRHGSGPVRVRALSEGGVARFEVRDGGPSSRAAPSGGDPRHGHGLRLAAAVAAGHGGALVPPRSARDGGTVTTLSVPTARERG